jgi:hypothetical protein
MTEMVDFFPTVVELMGLPKIDKCKGVDQPPLVDCVQGESYASEFFPIAAETNSRASSIHATSIAEAVEDADAALKPPAAKVYAFSQWPYPPDQTGGLVDYFRMGYSVRSKSGYRCVPLLFFSFSFSFLFQAEASNLESIKCRGLLPRHSVFLFKRTPAAAYMSKHRYTEYVPYSTRLYKGVWTAESHDPELYDYHVDPDETTNCALNATYAVVVTELKAALRQQFVPGTLF